MLRKGDQMKTQANQLKNNPGDLSTGSTARLPVQPLGMNFSLKDKVYASLKEAIMAMDIYAHGEELRLDERQLSVDLGVSRTPIREAISRLEQEGFVRVVQRRGVFVIRKTKKEVLDMIAMWAALESMAARLATQHATDEELAALRQHYANSENDESRAHIDEYSKQNILFHQTILQMSKNKLIIQTAENLFAHMRSIRTQTIGELDRVERSIIDHQHIIDALESRDTDKAENLVRLHTLDLALHVEQNVHYLD